MTDTDWSDWDPMIEDYNDLNFNTYNSGAGAKIPLEMQPVNLRNRVGEKSYTLWVSPLDSRYSEESLKNIFSNYGVVTDVKIVYPKSNGYPFGYVTFKSQTSATDAIRGFNDNEKFDFKCHYAYDRTNVNSNEKYSKNNRSSNFRFNDSGPLPRKSDSNRYEENSNASKSFNEPSLKFTKAQKIYGDQKSFDNSGFRDSTKFCTRPPPNVNHSDNNSPAKINNVKQGSCILEPYNNVLPGLQSTSVTSVDSTTSSATRHVYENSMEFENLDLEKYPEDITEKSTTTYLMQMPCCHCKALTWNICRECGKSFCHAECSLDSWRCHTNSECVKVAELVKQGLVNIAPKKNTSIDSEYNVKNARLTNEQCSKNINVTSESDFNITESGVRKYASDYSSPATEYKNFPNLVSDYIANGNKSLANASRQSPKLNAVCDNYYDDNTSRIDTYFGKKQPEQSQPVPHFQLDGPKFQRQDSSNYYESKRGRSSENDVGQGKGFKPRENSWESTKEYGHSGGRNFKLRDDNREGANDNNRHSSGPRKEWNQRQYDGNSGFDKNEQGGSRSRSGFDRRKNFADRSEKKQNDEVDNANTGTTKSSRGSYQNDRNDHSDSKINFDKSRGSHHVRNTAQSRLEGISNNADGKRISSYSNESKDSRRLGNQQLELKTIELNETVEVTIVSIEPNGDKCYVRLADNEEIFLDLLKIIKEIPLPPLEKKSKLIGSKCIALLNNEWQRGVIRSEQPIKILFVDVGITTEVDLQNIREVPKHIADYRIFAFRVALSNVSRDEMLRLCTENKVISIKATYRKKDDRFFFVAEKISFEEQLADERKDDNRDTQRPAASASMPSIPVTVTELQPNVVCEQIPQLQRKQAVKVYVSHIENQKEFYIGFADSLININNKLSAEDVDSLSTMIDVQQNGLALAPYLGDWCRAEIVSTDPLQVNFIDYGNVEPCEAKKLKILPASYMNIPPLAVKVKLLVGTVTELNISADTAIVITPIMKEADNIWSVVVGVKSANEYELLLQQAQSAFSQSAQPKPQVFLDFYITFAKSKGLIYGVPKPDTVALDALNTKINSISFQPVTNPLVLDKIYVKSFDKFWCRARLIKIDPIEIYFIDFGNSETCQKEDLFELPSDMQHDPPPLAVEMILERESQEIIEFGEYVSVVWDMEKNTYSLTHDPTDPDSIKASKKSVNVVSTLGDSNYAVIFEENRSVYKYIYQTINSTVDQLGKPKKIEINVLCLAVYEDENWHRAKIVKKSPLSVYFLDFAHEMLCDFGQLKEMPLEVAGIPPLAFKIKTENFIELEDGSELKITFIEELEYNYWKVATIQEKYRVGFERIEIISDPKQLSPIKKQAKTPATANSTLTTSTPKDVVIDDDDDDDDDVVEVKISPNKIKEGRDTANIFETVPPKVESLIKPFDETSLVFTRLSCKSKDYPRGPEMIANSMEDLSLIEPQQNTTFYDINVSISEHLLDSLGKGDSCVLVVYDSLSDDEYAGMLLCKKFEPVINALDRIEKSVNNSESFSAKRGDLVAAFVNGINNWHRGYVVNEPSNVDPYYLLILFDAGRLYRTDLVYRLEEEYRCVPQLAVRINVTHFQPVPDDIARLEVIPMNVNLTKGDTHEHDKSIYRVELTRKLEDYFEATLKSQFCGESVSHKINLTKWRPTREEIGVKHVPVMAGDLVKIGDFRQTNQCYIIPIDEAINEQRMTFLSEVAMHCKRAKSIETELKLNEIIGVPFMQSYYRAQIIERKNDSYMVRILDIGEETKVLKSNIKQLPDALKFANCFAISIRLHNVPCTDFTQLAAHLIKYVVDYECYFTMEINECTRLVELVSNEEFEKVDLKKGTSFNYLLSQYLVPQWKIQELDFNARYYLMQLKFEEWTIGSELSLHFVEALDEKSGLMINRYGETYFKIFLVNLHQRLKEYAEETHEQSYVPVKEELCVAKFEENWFRAVCVHAEPGKSITLQFLDIGYKRTVPHTDIRRIHSDFLKHPAAAIFCKIVNYQDCRSVSELVGKVLKKCRVLRKIEDGGYDIQVVNLKAYQ